MLLLFQDYSLVEVIYLLIRFSKFLFSLKISDTSLFLKQSHYFPNPSLFMGRGWKNLRTSPPRPPTPLTFAKTYKTLPSPLYIKSGFQLCLILQLSPQSISKQKNKWIRNDCMHPLCTRLFRNYQKLLLMNSTKKNT